MIRLILKEARQLVPITILWLAILVTNIIYLGFTKRFDEESFYTWCEDYCGYTVGPEMVFPFVVLILIFAYSLFPREHDEGTIDVLYAMPVSRAGVFFSKVIAALAIMSMLITLDYLIDPTLFGLNRSSMDGRLYSNVLIPMIFRDFIFAYVVLSYGILLSWFRTIGLLIFVVYIIVIGIVESVIGDAGAFNLFTFHNNDYFGQGLKLNWSTILPHVIAATIALIIGGLLWSNTDSKKNQKTKWNSKWISIPLSVITFILLFAGITADIQMDHQESEASLVAKETEHYRFVYNDIDSAKAEAVIRVADTDYEALANLLGVIDNPYIQTDLTDNNAHAAGLATWKTIKMDLSRPNSDFNRHVLNHETAHVFQGVASDRVLMEGRGHTKFFIEGMADYVAQLIAPYDDIKELNETIGAVSWKIQKIRFDDMIDFEGFKSKYNPELVYTMGSLWSEAMANTCGVESLGDVLRAMGREGAPRGLFGKVFWQDNLQEIGCELESVNASWRSLMQNQIDVSDTSWVTEFSEIHFAMSEDETALIAQATARPHPDFKDAMSRYVPGSYDIRIASETQFSASGDTYISGRIVDDSDPQALKIEFQIKLHNIPDNQFRYQLGISKHPESFGYFSRWKKGRLP